MRFSKLSVGLGSVLAVALGVSFQALAPAPAEAQIFAKGARTEFISGFGFRTFASFRRLVLDEPGEPERRVHVRETPLGVVYGVTRRLSVVATLPIVDKRLEQGNLSLDSGTGPGDAVLLAKWRIFRRLRGRSALRIAAEAGVKLPTGADDLRDASGRPLPRALQRGTGSWDPTADVIVTWVPPGLEGRLILGADAGFTLATEAGGFDAGNRVDYDAVLKYRVLPRSYPGRDTFLLLELNGRWRGRARSDGLEVDDSGGHVASVSPGIQFLARQNVVLEAGVQVPVSRDLHGAQPQPTVRVLGGIRYIVVF